MKKIELTQSPIDARLEAFGHVIGQHWLRFVALSVTAILTGYAGFSYTRNVIFSLALVALAEGASLYWAGRIEDAGNRVQMIAAVIGTVIAWSSIAMTDLASVVVIAHGAELFSVFASVPVLAQEVIVYVLPSLAVLQGTLGTLHYFFSEEARLNREVNKTLREASWEIAQANASARVAIARSHAKTYKARAEAEAGKIGERLGAQAWQDHTARYTPRSEEQRQEIAEAAADEIPFGSNGRGAK